MSNFVRGRIVRSLAVAALLAVATPGGGAQAALFPLIDEPVVAAPATVGADIADLKEIRANCKAARRAVKAALRAEREAAREGRRAERLAAVALADAVTLAEAARPAPAPIIAAPPAADADAEPAIAAPGCAAFAAAPRLKPAHGFAELASDIDPPAEETPAPGFVAGLTVEEALIVEAPPLEATPLTRDPHFTIAALEAAPSPRLKPTALALLAPPADESATPAAPVMTPEPAQETDPEPAVGTAPEPAPMAQAEPLMAEANPAAPVESAPAPGEQRLAALDLSPEPIIRHAEAAPEPAQEPEPEPAVEIAPEIAPAAQDEPIMAEAATAPAEQRLAALDLTPEAIISDAEPEPAAVETAPEIAPEAPVTEPVAEPAAAPAVEPAIAPVADPVTEPIVEPIAAPVASPVTEPVERLAPPPPGIARPPLWRVGGERGQIWLLGSFHILPRGLDWRSPAVARAIDSAETIWFEAEVDTVEARQKTLHTLMMQGFNPAGVTLTSILGAQDAARLAQIADNLGVPMSAIDPMRPWQAFLTLSVQFIISQGFEAGSGVETALLAEARTRGRTLRFFETVDGQLALFTTLTPEEEKALLRVTLREWEKQSEQFAALFDAWRAGDAAAIDTLMNRTMRADAPRIYEILIARRNRAWAERIAAMGQGSGPTLIVVGAAHLAGEGSVPDILRARGITVERVNE